MSNQGYHSQGNEGYYGGAAPHDPQSNPWADQTSQAPQGQYPPQQPHQQYPPQQQPFQQQPPQGQHGGFDAPPGPPPRRSDTFNEQSYVPEAERGEQREAMEQFELSRSQPESQTDRDVAALSAEFPGVDSSLIAALYSDSQNVGATKEILQELDAQAKGQH